MSSQTLPDQAEAQVLFRYETRALSCEAAEVPHVGQGKRYVSRTAMPPAFALVSVLQTYDDSNTTAYIAH